MSNSVQGIHDGNGQTCRFPEAGEADAMSLAGPGEPDSKLVLVPDHRVFIEGALFLQKRCGRGGEFYNPKTHYCMDGAVRQYPDQKALAELKRQKEEAVVERQRALAERRTLEAKGVVFCGPDESSEDCWARAGDRPGADNFTYEDLPGWAQVVVDVGEPVAVVATATAAVLTAPVSVVVIAGGALLATGCAPDQEIPEKNPVAQPTRDPDIIGDPTKRPTKEDPDAKEPPPILAPIKAHECMPADYVVELILDVQQAKQAKLVSEDGEEEFEPVDGCSRILLADRAQNFDANTNTVTFTKIVGHWASSDADYGKTPAGEKGYAPLLDKITKLRLSGAPLADFHFPYEYQDIYDFAGQAGLRWLSTNAALEVKDNKDCKFNFDLQTKISGTDDQALPKFVLAVYSGDENLCRGIHPAILDENDKPVTDSKGNPYYSYYDNERIIALKSAAFTFTWQQGKEAGWMATQQIELCGPNSSNGFCEGVDGSSVGEAVTAKIIIRPRGEGDITTTP